MFHLHCELFSQPVFMATGLYTDLFPLKYTTKSSQGAGFDFYILKYKRADKAHAFVCLPPTNFYRNVQSRHD